MHGLALDTTLDGGTPVHLDAAGAPPGGPASRQAASLAAERLHCALLMGLEQGLTGEGARLTCSVGLGLRCVGDLVLMSCALLWAGRELA